MRYVLVFTAGFLVSAFVFESYHVSFLRNFFWEYAFLAYVVFSTIICGFKNLKFALTAFCVGIASMFAAVAGAIFDFTILRVDRNLWPFEAVGLMLSFTFAFAISYGVLRELGLIGWLGKLRD